MTTVFKGTPKFDGISGDYARVTEFRGHVLIRAIDAMAEEAVTIAMTPEQARALAAGVMAAADKAEGGCGVTILHTTMDRLKRSMADKPDARQVTLNRSTVEAMLAALDGKSVTSLSDAAIRAIDPAEVLAKAGEVETTPAPDAVARLVEADTPRAWTDVLDERKRQITVEGWTPEHDDAHEMAEMAQAAACYALSGTPADEAVFIHGRWRDARDLFWPRQFGREWWKPTNRRRDLVKAGALILAEIERLDRTALAACKEVRDALL